MQQREAVQTAIANLGIETAKVEGGRNEADLRPVRYLATLVGTTDETRLFILVVALRLDPAAVLLRLAATHRGRQ